MTLPPLAGQSALQNLGGKMTNKRTDSGGLPTYSAPENQTVQVSASTVTADPLPNKENKFLLSDHRGVTHQDPAAQVERPQPGQSTHSLLKDEAQSTFDPFIFVNEQELHRSSNSELRRKIRSHVRRGIHMKQRRLNAASKPDSTGVKKLLRRSELESREIVASRNRPVLSFGTEIVPRSTIIRDQLEGHMNLSASIRTAKRPRQQGVDASMNILPSGPLSHARGDDPSTHKSSFYPKAEPLSQISRYQLDSSKNSKRLSKSLLLWELFP